MFVPPMVGGEVRKERGGPEMMTMKCFAKGLPALVAGILITSGTAEAAPVVIDMGQQYWSNTAVPTEAGPWMRATIEQTGANTVTVNLERLLSDPNTAINRWVFNLDPNMNVNNLQVTQTSGPEAHVLKNPNGVGVGGGSLFDVRLLWPSAPGRTFDGSHSNATFTMTMNGLTPESFLFGSIGGHPTATDITSVAFLQNVNGNTNGVTWVRGDQSATSVIPLPPAAWAGAMGLVLAGAYVRRRRM